MNAMTNPKPKAATAQKKPPGRPPKDDLRRLHLYVRADAKGAMQKIGRLIDASGPTEIVRMAIRHCANMLALQRRGAKVVFVGPDGVDHPHEVTVRVDDYSVEKTRLHVHLSEAADRDLTICEAIIDQTGASAIVGTCLFVLLDWLNMVNNGLSPVVIDRGGDRVGYSLWSTTLEADKVRIAKVVMR